MNISLSLISALAPGNLPFQQNRNSKNIPIIAVSALTRDENRQQAIKFGCNDYLSKPYLIDELYLYVLFI